MWFFTRAVQAFAGVLPRVLKKKDASTTKPPFSQCWYCIRCGSASQAKSRIRRCGRQFEMAGSAGVACEFTAVVRPGRLQAFGLPDPDNSSWAGGIGGKNSRPQGANRVRRRPFGAAAGLRRAGRSVILLLGRLDDSAEGIQRRDDGEFVRDRRCQVLVAARSGRSYGAMGDPLDGSPVGSLAARMGWVLTMSASYMGIPPAGSGPARA